MEISKKLLIIGFVWPEPKSSAAGSRMLQLISMFQELSYEIVFASTASLSEFMFDVSTIGIRKVPIVLNSSSFDLFVKEENPTVVLFDRYLTEEQFGWRVAEQCPKALRILDSEDLHFLRHARQLAVKENRNFLLSDLFSDTAKREIASILRCDCTLIISEFEMELLKNHFSISNDLLYYLPMFAEKISDLPSFETRKDFVFIGNFLHEPNLDAVKYLSKEIWPLIHTQLTEAKMFVYGAYPSQQVLELHNPKRNFYSLGRADSAFEVIKNAKVLLAPLRFGAGIKGKLLEAMQCGTPSVSSSIGAEGMNGSLEWNGFLADDVDGFSNYALQLYQDINIWEAKQSNGFSILKERFSTALFRDDFLVFLEQIIKDLELNRRKNFFGAILQHHTLASTKYMSKWIEEKNK